MNTELVEKLNERLKNGKVSFTYNKVDGTERKAIGTKNEDLIEAFEGADAFKASGRKRSEDVICYYDIDKKNWRTFRKENLVSIDD